MTAVPSKSKRDQNGLSRARSIADELQQESDRLLQLAAKLKVREEALAEMERYHPQFRDFVYAMFREECLNEKWPDKDLETLAREWDAKPLEEFISEFECANDAT